MSRAFGLGVRLRARSDFTVVQERGRRVSTRYLILLGHPNTLNRDRLGIIASRRFGGAVTRNRAKRRLREVFRGEEPDLSVARGRRALDLVVIPKRELLTAPIDAIRADFRSAVRRLRGERSASNGTG